MKRNEGKKTKIKDKERTHKEDDVQLFNLVVNPWILAVANRAGSTSRQTL